MKLLHHHNSWFVIINCKLVIDYIITTNICQGIIVQLNKLELMFNKLFKFKLILKTLVLFEHDGYLGVR
jgi:hypothetical protein